MKKAFIIALGALIIMSSCSNKEEYGYIGPSNLKSETSGTAGAVAAMTPEAMHELGYISDPQMSPDGSTILYGITYTSIEKNAACRNLWICAKDGSGK